MVQFYFGVDTRLRLKLLDLTGRNRLLNFKFSERSTKFVRIVDEVPAQLHARLIGEDQGSGKLYFEALPEPPDETEEVDPADTGVLRRRRIGRGDVQPGGVQQDMLSGERGTRLSLADWARKNDINPSYELPLKADPTHSGQHSDDKIQTLLLPESMEAKLSRIRDDARLAEQEQGFNTLHLAFGFLEWYEDPRSDEPQFAPLFLLPVQIDREIKGHQYRYFVRCGEETESTDNPSLREKLKRDFGLELPRLEEDQAPDDYLAKVEKAIADMRRWKVLRFAVIGHFSFARIAMYEDLAPDNWGERPLEGQPLIGGLLAGTESDGDSGFAADFDTESPEVEQAVPALLMDADSSQFSAITDAMRGRSFALQGPPGTGKSQTIANLIGAALAAGRTVLFVAEKQAALDVVASRLTDAGLADFVLELHSTKSQKKRFYESFAKRLALGARAPRESEALDSALRDLRALRATLRHYVEVLNAPVGASEITVHEALWKEQVARQDLTKTEHELTEGRLTRGGDALGKAAYAALLGSVRQLVTALRDLNAVAGALHHPLYGFWAVTVDHSVQRQFTASLSSAESAVEAYVSVAGRMSSSLKLGPIESLSAGATLSRAAASLPASAPGRIDVAVRLQRPEDAKVLRETLGGVAAAHDAAGVLGQVIEGPYPVGARAEQILQGIADLGRETAALRVSGQRLGALRRVLDQLRDGMTRSQKTLQIFGQWGSAQGLAPVVDETAVRHMCAVVRLLRETPQTVLRRRDPALFREESKEAALHAASVADVLKERVARMQGAARLTGTEAPEPLLEDALILQSTAFLVRWLSPAYRGAKRRYQTMARQSCSRDQAIQNLRAWADVLADRRKFEGDAAMAASLGLSAITLEAPFRDLGAVVDYWRAVRRQWSALEERGAAVQKVMLHGDEQALDDLKSGLGETDLDEVEAVVAGAGPPEEALASRQRQIERVGRALDAVTVAQWTADPPMTELTSIGNAMMRFARAAQQVQASPWASELWGVGSPVGGDALAGIKGALKYADAVHSAQVPIVARTLLLSERCGSYLPNLKRFSELLVRAGDDLGESMGRLRAFSGSAAEGTWLADVDALPVTELRRHLANAVESASTNLADWAVLCEARGELIAGGAESLGTAVLEGRARLEKAEQCVSRLYCRSLLHEAAERTPALRGWTGAKLGQIRQRLAEADRSIIQMMRERVRQRLLARMVPSGNGTGPKKEWTNRPLIENEAAKQARHIPLRELFRRAMPAAAALKPCFMMSPASVSLYLQRAPAQFDIAVIDEASQMRPEDILGTLARSRQIVVVGDPLQLPPTTFFDSMADGQDSGDEGADLRVDSESVLEMAMTQFRPMRDLRWHYRSQHESLIAFSNRKFYDDRLVLFPSPKARTMGLGIRHEYVADGLYRSSLNEKEAQRVIEVVKSLIREDPDRSIGIVAVNQPQRDLLLDEMDRAFAEDERLEAYRVRWAETLEPFFVNNLENVQGHERDVIVISTVYGPEAPGAKVMQRFGPINSKYGHRRLNVLFTRAKQQVVLVTSLRAEDIQPTPGSQPGVEAFKQYIEYSRSGRLDGGERSGRGPESPFEEAVAQVISVLGYSVQPQVGVKGYFVDMAVTHPSRTDHYVLGIECDGATYHSGKCARDRDRLRQEVLERLGWTLYRIWSTDWFNNRDREVGKLRERIEKAVAEADR